MIITTFSKDGTYKLTRSDSNHYIKNTTTGGVYIDAFDIVANGYEYEELEQEIEYEVPEPEILKSELFKQVTDEVSDENN